MFAISYSAPQSPDPNQRDNYFLGQETGFRQMAEVAADRNEKRRIELSRQQLALARQQESRIARENSIKLQLQKRQQAIAEKVLPLEMANANLNIKKTLSEMENARESLVSQSRNVDLSNNISRSLSQPAVDTASILTPRKQPESVAETPREQLKSVETRMTEPEPKKSAVITAPRSQIDAARLIAQSIGGGLSRPVATAEEKASKERQAGFERTATLMGQTRGFGISDKGYKDFLYEFSDIVS